MTVKTGKIVSIAQAKKLLASWERVEEDKGFVVWRDPKTGIRKAQGSTVNQWVEVLLRGINGFEGESSFTFDAKVAVELLKLGLNQQAPRNKRQPVTSAPVPQKHVYTVTIMEWNQGLYPNHPPVPVSPISQEDEQPWRLVTNITSQVFGITRIYFYWERETK